MANVDSPRGLWPLYSKVGGEIRQGRYRVNDATDTGLFKGDLVSIEDGGNIDASAVDAGVIVVGVFAGAEATKSGKRVWLNTIPADPITAGYSDIWAYVWDDPYTVFGIQADTGTALAEATSLYETANHVAGAGSATTGISAHELDASDVGTGGQLKIIGKIDRPDNTWAEHVDLEVMIAEHFYNAAVAGV